MQLLRGLEVELFNIKNDDVKKRCLDAIKNKTGKFSVKIIKIQDKRSLQQNALMWSWFKVLADWNGETDECWHCRMRDNLGMFDVVDVEWMDFETGEIVRNKAKKYWSSKKFTVEQMSAYLNAIEIELISHDLAYPQPNYYGLEIK